MRIIHETICKERNVTLTGYLLHCGGDEFSNMQNRPAVLILPGGAYRMCSDREAEPVALAYNRVGYNAFVLKYSVCEHRTWPNPLNDYEQAMQLIREKCSLWQVISDKIAVIGFSAGAHLGACAGTIAKNRPNALLLGYGVLLEKTINTFGDGFPSPIEKIDDQTPPTFLFSACDDKTVAVENTTMWANSLAQKKVPFECHIYYYGGHGFSLADDTVGMDEQSICSRIPNWVQDSTAWLKDVFGQLGKRPKIINFSGVESADAQKKFLGIDNSIGYLMKNLNAAAILREKVPMLFSNTRAQSGYVFSLRRVGIASKWSETLLNELENALSKIPNEGA